MEPSNRGESDLRQRPWVTLGFLSAMLAGTALVDFGGEPVALSRWGLIPDYVSFPSLLTYGFLQSGWAHLWLSMMLFFLLGPALEERWGRAFFAGFVVLAGVAAGGAHVLADRSSVVPLVGANGVIAALMGATLVRFHSAPVRFLHGPWSLGLLHRDLWTPAWAMLPVWFLAQLLLAAFAQKPGVVGSAAPWCTAAGFAFGAAVAAGLRWGDIEGRLINSAGEPTTTSRVSSVVEQSFALRTSGQSDAAWALLAAAVRAGTRDPEVVAAVLESACECGHRAEASSSLLGLVEASLGRGEEAFAIGVWAQLSERIVEVQPERRLVLRLVPVLVANNRRELAISTLRRAFDPRAERLRTGPALQLLEVAKTLDPPSALVAVRRVLEDPGYPHEKRSRLEEHAAQLTLQCESLPAFDPDAVCESRDERTGDRRISIELDPEYDIVLPSQSEAPPAAAPRVRELDATGSLVASDSNGELCPDSPPPDANAPRPAAAPESLLDCTAGSAVGSVSRFFGVKVVEAVPDQLVGDGVVLKRHTGGSGLVAYSRIQALAVAAVEGLADKPVLVIDLLMNWNDPTAEQLQVIRLRSDRFDVRALSPDSTSSIAAFRAVLEQLLARAEAVPLPSRDAVCGRPFATHGDLAAYQRAVLQVDE